MKARHHRCGGCGRKLSADHHRPYYCSPECHASRRKKARGYARKYYAADPEKHRERSREYVQRNPEKLIASRKRYYEENREVESEKRKAWTAANKDKVVAGWRRWVAAHPETNRAKVRAWQLANPDKYKAQGRKKRARQRAAPGGHTAAEWRACVDQYGGCCFYCGARKPLTADHVVALSRGGTDNIDNLVPACRRCNSSKKASDVRVWLDRMRREGKELTSFALALLVDDVEAAA